MQTFIVDDIFRLPDVTDFDLVINFLVIKLVCNWWEIKIKNLEQFYAVVFHSMHVGNGYGHIAN